jgi:hypothetical protein
MKKVAVVVRDRDQQYEALRTSLGALLESHAISMFVLDHEIDMIEEYRDNLDIFGEMDGLYFSNNEANVEKHGFTSITREGLIEKLRDMDTIIPFH